MKYYACFNVKDFIICIGHNGYVLKEFFLNYRYHFNDFTINLKNGKAILDNNVLEDWNVTLVETGLDTQTGGRINQIEKYIKNDCFFMTYGDGLSNVNIKSLLKTHQEQNKVATVTSVIPPGRFGLLKNKGNKVIKFSEHTSEAEPNTNGGFFVLNKNIFKYTHNHETIFEQNIMVDLIEDKELVTYHHKGFWQPMDTVRDKITLDSLWYKKEAPWKIWK